MFIGERGLEEPFFSQTVANIRERDPAILEMETDLATLVKEQVSRRIEAPAAFIFHISRCGSTLVCNGLKAATNVQIVAEADPICRLFAPCLPNIEQIDKVRMEEEREQLARRLADIFSTYRFGSNHQPIVVKFTSQNTLSLRVIRRIWPTVPSLYVIRYPVEVMVSNLRMGGLARFTDYPSEARSIAGIDPTVSISQICTEEFCARVIGRYLQMFAETLSGLVRIVDYNDINPQSILEIARFFHLDTALCSAELNGVFQTYSKDPCRLKHFVDDRGLKRTSATVQVMEAAERWTFAEYSRLRSISQPN